MSEHNEENKEVMGCLNFTFYEENFDIHMDCETDQIVRGISALFETIITRSPVDIPMNDRVNSLATIVVSGVVNALGKEGSVEFFERIVLATKTTLALERMKGDLQ